MLVQLDEKNIQIWRIAKNVQKLAACALKNAEP